MSIITKRKVLYIGGSPCSGKSTLAETLAKKHHFKYYKCDNFLEDYIRRGAEKNVAIMRKFQEMDINQTWLKRSIDQQVHDEIEFYREAFKIIQSDIQSLYKEDEDIIVEGAAILPQNIINNSVSPQNYICIIPTRDFQIKNYSQREWVKHYLSECRDPVKAFENWMERDVQFAERIKEVAMVNNMKLIIEDGSKSIYDRYLDVADYWSLK